MLLTLFVFSSPASKSVQPPDPDKLVGAWIGFDQNHTYFCRLEPTANRKGFFSTVLVTEPADLYVIENFSLDGFTIAFDLKPDKQAENIYVKGLADTQRMFLEMGGIGKKWKREFTLFNDQE